MRNNYENKRILFMGDSITALGGWVRRFNEIIKPSFFVNIAVSGATWQDKERTLYDGNPIMDKENINNTLCNQLEKLLRGRDADHPYYQKNPDYDDFDMIIVAAGTNDGEIGGLYNNGDAVTESQFTQKDGKPLPLATVDRKTWPGVMRYLYERLKQLYPSADVFYCTPIQATEELRPYASIKAKRDYIIRICDRLSDACVIDTFRCGICGIYETAGTNGRDLIDGLHPNASGEMKIARYNANAIMKYYL